LTSSYLPTLEEDTILEQSVKEFDEGAQLIIENAISDIINDSSNKFDVFMEEELSKRRLRL
jgi:pyoverdine/dityrosine biosynthesis protein Dit1